MKPDISKFLLLGVVTSLVSGCASSGPPLPPSLELPRPVTDLRALRKGDKVYLAWTVPTQTTDHQSVRAMGPTLICRSLAATLTDCGTPVGEVAASAAVEKTLSKNRSAATAGAAGFVDRLPLSPAKNPREEFTYAVKVLNGDRRGAGLSNLVREPSAPALPPPGGFQAEITADGVRISWRCPPAPGELAGAQYRLRIYRRLLGTQADTKVAEPDLRNCQGPAVLDQTFEWEKTYDYRAASVLAIAGPGQPEIEIEGDDTPAVRVFAHDVFPPAVPTGLQAVFSGVGQSPFVDLIWSPDIDADLAGYNVYRRESNGVPAKLNSEPVKAPAYRDRSVRSGKQYFYSVSALDVRGNESVRSEEANEAVP
jgi:hypothetical protein